MLLLDNVTLNLLKLSENHGEVVKKQEVKIALLFIKSEVGLTLYGAGPHKLAGLFCLLTKLLQPTSEVPEIYFQYR